MCVYIKPLSSCQTWIECPLDSRTFNLPGIEWHSVDVIMCVKEKPFKGTVHLVWLKGWLTVFFLGLIVFMGCSLACVHACFFFKRIIFSHNLPLFHTSLSLLWQTPRSISWFYEAPPSEIRDGLRLVSWLSMLCFAKPPLLHVWTSRPSPQWHVLRLNCKQWCCL